MADVTGHGLVALLVFLQFVYRVFLLVEAFFIFFFKVAEAQGS